VTTESRRQRQRNAILSAAAAGDHARATALLAEHAIEFPEDRQLLEPVSCQPIQRRQRRNSAVGPPNRQEEVAMTNQGLFSASGENQQTRRSGVPWGRFLTAIPLAWVVVALVHPQGSGDAYEGLQDEVGLWIGVHLAQPVLALGLAAVLWVLLLDRRGAAPTVARFAIPVWLVSFTVFDSIAGLATGLAIRHATGLAGAEEAGAASAAQYMLDNHLAGGISPVWFLQATAFVTIIIATALVLRSAGASRALFVAMLVGALHVFHAGPISAVGLVAITVAVLLANREGLIGGPHHVEEIAASVTR